MNTCQHVIEKCGANRLYCGKPARYWLAEYGWKLCGIHSWYWQRRGLDVTEIAR